MRSTLLCATLAIAAACGDDATPEPPHTSLVQTPQALTASNTATFGFYSDDPDAAFECVLDGGEAEECTSPKTYTALGEGEHSFIVTASNDGGSDPEPPSFTWTISHAAPPVAQITGGPDAHWGSTTATLWFVSDVPATFACAMDEDPAGPCSSPSTYNGLVAGEHTFTVTATANGMPSDPVSYTFRVDVAPPITTVDTAPPDFTSATSATFSFHADEAGTFLCQLDDEVAVPCASPVAWGGLAAGPHAVRIWGTDAVGNVELPGVTTVWTVDFDPPQTALDDGPLHPSNDPDPSFAFDSDEAGTFLCTLDGGTASPCASPLDLEDLVEGDHTFTVAAVDLAGNVDTDPASYTWTVDVTPPAPPATATATAGNRSVAVTWAAATGAVSYTIYVDDGLGETAVTGVAGTSHTLTSLVNCGAYSVAVAAVDAAGNESGRITRGPVSPRPDAPETFTLAPQPDGSVELSWSAVANATEYELAYGGTSSGPYTGTGASIGDSPVVFADTSTNTSGLAPPTATYFVVTAQDGTCEGAASVERRYDCTNTLELCTTSATVDGVTADYLELWSVDQFQRVVEYSGANFILMQDVSFAGEYLGSIAASLSTHFYGNGHTLSDYYTYDALFDTIEPSGEISDLTIREADITNADDFALLATHNHGLILRCDVEGTSSGGGYNKAQGLVVARNSGVVRETVASGTVSTSAYANSAGGFVGINAPDGLIDRCAADVDVVGGGQAYILGGFAGMSSGSIIRSSAHGNVDKTGVGSPDVGGFVGVIGGDGLIDLCFATGDVFANSTYGSSLSLVGGLVGYNAYGMVSRSYATGDVTVPPTAQNRAGGLVGATDSSYTTDGHGNHIPLGVVVDSYALGDVHGDAQWAGGLIGFNMGTLKRSWSAGVVTGDAAGSFYGGYYATADAALADSFCLGSATGSSSTDPFGAAPFNGGVVVNGWFLGAVGATSSTGATVVTDPAAFSDASHYGASATGAPALPWDVDYIWLVDGANPPTLRDTDIALTASPSTATAGSGSITATVTVTDENGDPAPGVAVTFWSTSATVSFSPETGITDASGVFTSTVTASSSQQVTLQAIVFSDLRVVPVTVSFE